MNSVWAVKHRPPTLADMVGQEAIVKEMQGIAQRPDRTATMQHFIFHSREPGTGKTSMAFALAADLGWPIHLYNASSKHTRGIAFVEEELRPLSSMGMHQQIIFLDEADQLTADAQSALKGVIETAQCFFILTCNDLSKVSPWLQSRCQVRTFTPIGHGDMVGRLREIAIAEGSSFDDFHPIANAHNGDLRNAINCMQTASSLSGDDRLKFIRSLSSSPLDTMAYLRKCFRDKDFQMAFKEIEGRPVRQAVRDIFSYAMESGAKTESKMVIVDAAITAERDLIAGVDEDIVARNFVRMCLNSAESVVL